MEIKKGENMSEIKLEVCGGCNAKIPAGDLDKILSNIPTLNREDILVGFETKDDAAVVKVSDDTAMIYTLDFFPTMVSDPFVFGEIAAANAMSDVYSMGGQVVCALNIVCFPEDGDVKVLEEILKGGAYKVMEAGGTLVGGHSIHDPKIKYGMSVTGKVHPEKIWKNNRPGENDLLILTKPLGVTLITNAYNVGICNEEEFELAISSMTKLNKTSRDILSKYDVSSATDVTGFGLLAHLSEMVDGNYTAIIEAKNIKTLPGARKAADEFVLTKGGQNNRNFMEGKVEFQIDDFPMEEILFDPQTSGGLLVSINEKEGLKAIEEMEEAGIEAGVIGRVHKRFDKDIFVI